jgi:hypothetical protein
MGGVRLDVGFGSAPDSGSKPLDGGCGISGFEFGRSGSSTVLGVAEGSWASADATKPIVTNKSFAKAFIPIFRAQHRCF